MQSMFLCVGGFLLSFLFVEWRIFNFLDDTSIEGKFKEKSNQFIAATVCFACNLLDLVRSFFFDADRKSFITVFALYADE